MEDKKDVLNNGMKALGVSLLPEQMMPTLS